MSTLPIYVPGCLSAPVPVNPPQIAGIPFENFDQIATVTRWTRLSFQALGYQAPAFDPSWPFQSWFNPTADPTNPYTYDAVQQSPGGVFNFEPWFIGPVTIPGARACTPNIPGRPTYPKYVGAPADSATSQGTLVNPTVLSTAVQAQALAAALTAAAGASGVVQVVQGPQLTYGPDDPGDLWMDWVVQGGGLSSGYYVGTLLLQQYAQGVGAPGSWSIVNGGALWIPAPAAADGISMGVPSTAIATPVRPLLPNEKIIIEGFGTPLILVAPVGSGV